MKKYRIDFISEADNSIVESHRTDTKKKLVKFYKKFFYTGKELNFHYLNCTYKVYQENKEITESFFDYMMEV